jgi:hypothetical protein
MLPTITRAASRTFCDFIGLPHEPTKPRQSNRNESIMRMSQDMISLIFESEQLAKTTKLAPAPFFRITGNFISQGPNGTVVAKFSNHFWDMQGQQHFTQYACHDRTSIHFEDALANTSESFGPFDEISVADGVVYANGQLFARFTEETQLWHCYKTDTYWLSMIIASPPSL